MKLTRGFTIGDTGAGQAGNCTVAAVGTNFQTGAALPAPGAIAAETPSFTFSNINFTISLLQISNLNLSSVIFFKYFFSALDKIICGL